MVTLWSPNVQEPLVKMLCHRSAIRSMAISQSGNYMVTSGIDHLINVWDLRTYKQLKSLKVGAGASTLAFSQKNMVAAGMRNQVYVFKDDIILTGAADTMDTEENDENANCVVEMWNENRDVYLKNRLSNQSIQNVQFCPFEDVLGVGHGLGVSSLLVPGIYLTTICMYSRLGLYSF